MDGIDVLDLPGMPERPLVEFALMGTLERAVGEVPPVPVTWPAVVEELHTADLSEWRLRVQAKSAGIALQVAEMLLPEAAGASWVVSRVKVTGIVTDT